MLMKRLDQHTNGHGNRVQHIVSGVQNAGLTCSSPNRARPRRRPRPRPGQRRKTEDEDDDEDEHDQGLEIKLVQ